MSQRDTEYSGNWKERLPLLTKVEKRFSQCKCTDCLNKIFSVRIGVAFDVVHYSKAAKTCLGIYLRNFKFSNSVYIKF